MRTILQVLLALSLVLVVGCSGAAGQAAGHAAGTFVDCMTPAAKKLTDQLVPFAKSAVLAAVDDTGHVNWDLVTPQTKNLKADVSGCVFTTAIAEIVRAATTPPNPNAPQSAPLVVDVDDLVAGYERIHAQQLGGATFKLDPGPR